jgi:hypothetical protein
MSQQVKPFCKVCYDTGKPDHLFSNHFVRETRDPNSRITCPTLLALECRYCFVRGHTVSKCPKLEKVKADGECNHTACHAPRKTKPLSRDSDEESNGFSLLYSSDDENDALPLAPIRLPAAPMVVPLAVRLAADADDADEELEEGEIPRGEGKRSRRKKRISRKKKIQKKKKSKKHGRKRISKHK